MTLKIDRMHAHNSRYLDERDQIINLLDMLRGINVGVDPTRTQAVDSAGRRGQVSQSGDLIVGWRQDDISINFQYGVSTFDIKDGGQASGTGSISQIGSMAALNSGTGVGSAFLESLDSVRYRSGHESYCSPSVIFATPEAGVKQHLGFLNLVDGVTVGYEGLDFGIFFLEGGNETFVEQSNWNIDRLDGTGQSRYTLDPQGGQVPEIKFVWHGLKNITLEFVDDIGNSIPVHRFKYINDPSIDEVHLENPSLPFGARIERASGTGSNLAMKIGSVRAGVVSGREENNASNRWFSVTSLDFALQANVRNNLFTIQNKATYQGKTNHIILEIAQTDFVNDANKSLVVYGTKNATLSGNTAFTDLDTINSVVSVSRGGTIIGGARGPAAPVRSGDQRTNTDVLNTGVRIYPGETLTIEIETDGNINGTFTAVIRFVEYH